MNDLSWHLLLEHNYSDTLVGLGLGPARADDLSEP